MLLLTSICLHCKGYTRGFSSPVSNEITEAATNWLKNIKYSSQLWYFLSALFLAPKVHLSSALQVIFDSVLQQFADRAFSPSAN